MTKTEYKQQQDLIIKEFGNPEFELNQPQNESARRLTELKLNYLKERREVEKTEGLLTEFNGMGLKEEQFNPIPEELLKESWLTPFDEAQRSIVKAWVQFGTTKPSKLAEVTGLDRALVKRTIQSEAFKLLRGHLVLAYKSLWTLPAVAAVLRAIQSPDTKTALQAAKLALLDAGLVKDQQLDLNLNQPKEVLLDEATMTKLRELGDKIV